MKTVRQFEANRKRNPLCPCGKSNRDGKFSPEKGFAGLNVGHCHSCGKDFWGDEPTMFNKEPTTFKEVEIPAFCTTQLDDLKDHFDDLLESDFVQFLIKKFGRRRVKEAVERYYLGKLKSDVIFWQIDKDWNIRAGKIMSYNKKGKRQGFPKWWHKHIGGDCQVNQYFFGGHLISINNKPIAVVESEKTAIIMSIINPSFTWIACGGATQLQDNKCGTLPILTTTLFPDAGFYEDWEKIAVKWGFQISKDCEIWQAEGLIKEGDDIADYYLNKLPEEVEKIDPDWNQQEYDDIFKKT